MLRAAAIALLAVLAVACGKPDHIVIDPKEPVIRTKSEKIQLIAHIMEGSFEHVKEQVTWSSEDPEIAVVEGNGKLVGKAGGRTKLVATYKDLKASVPVEVAFVSKISSDTTTVTLDYEAGDPMKPVIEVIGYDGRKLKDRSVFIEAKDPKICRADGSGQLWPGNRGETVVLAKVEDLTIEIACVVK